MIGLPVDTGGARPIGPSLEPGLGSGLEPALAHALADELIGLTGLLADLAFDLAGNPDTLRHHMHSLQGIDRITQAQIAIADVLRAPGLPDRALAAVTLEELAASIAERRDRYRRDGVASDDDGQDAG